VQSIEADGDYIQWAVELPADAERPSRVIGNVMMRLVETENLCGEIGWVFHPDVAGQGYATEAARAVLDVSLAERVDGGIGLHRVIAELDPRNDASERLCQRLGMRREALFIKNVWMRDDWLDTLIYAVLAEEWPAATR
jgi:RimJ/RimL family protein N-acetyltransferase